MPVNAHHDNVPIQSNGRLLDPMHARRVKPAADATHAWDFYHPIATITGKHAFTPVDQTGCRLPHS